MGPDSDETAEDQVTASSEGPDVTVSQNEPLVVEGASEDVSEDAPAESESVEDLEGEPDNEAESEPADLVCTVHGGELRPAPGKWRWICDRTQEPGECVAGYRE